MIDKNSFYELLEIYNKKETENKNNLTNYIEQKLIEIFLIIIFTQKGFIK